jgi:hypothetical protein
MVKNNSLKIDLILPGKPGKISELTISGKFREFL